jgi:HTH-type transcriptional repressor of NAD biosynthesis genes
MSEIHGLVLGKFLPPHAGHVYLVEAALRRCDRLSVVVGTLAREPIPGRQRFEWMKELFPSANVVWLTDENPQFPEEHEEFWAIWRESLLRVLPRPPDVVFASEAYGQPLAEALGARFLPVDVARDAIPVSGTAIRRDPWSQWRWLPRPVRPHFLCRISIFGPESSGKTTLARALAEHFGTIAVPEYARTHLEYAGESMQVADFVDIGCGQAASEDALAYEADRRLFCDTDPLLTVAWSEALAGACDSGLRAMAEKRRYDLTLLLEPDLPWVADPYRYLPGGSQGFHARCVELLEQTGRDFVRISGSGEARWRAAVAAVAEIRAPSL